jgi:4-aminobutyrate aminotransferase
MSSAGFPGPSSQDFAEDRLPPDKEGFVTDPSQIRVAADLPGPRARALIEADERFTSPSYTRVYPLAVERAEGVWIEDVDGNRFLDFNAGIAVCATGHCHPRVVAAIREQAGKLLHYSGTDFYYGPQRDLAEKLAGLAPGGDAQRVFFTNSGAEAVEAAFKLARHHTGRQHVVAFNGAFHGRTLGALSLTCSKVVQRAGFAPLVPGVTHIDYPHCSRCPVGPKADGGCCLRMLDDLERNVFGRQVPPDEVAAIVVEPIQGEGGYIVPPPEFLPRLRTICDAHGILLICDEVQSGMGRTGRMLAVEHFGVVPDVICLAKGIASGLPLGAIVARESVMTWPPGSHASTFGGNPLCCVAALETIALLEEGLIAHTAEVGAYLVERLAELQTRHPLVTEVRGRGLMIGVELTNPDGTPAVEAQREIVRSCFERGLLILGCGKSALRLSPPLVVEREQVDLACEILDEVLDQRP